jgi:hypothetical protein
VGIILSFGPPRLLWLNEGPRLDYPWYRGAGALVAAAAFLAAAFLPRSKAGKVAAGLPAVLLLTWSAHLFAVRVEAGRNGLVAQGLRGRHALAWREVVGVDPEPERLVVRGPAEPVIIPTRGAGAEDRARLERTIARRVREATAPQATPAP